MYCGAYNTCTSKTYDNKNTKDEKGEIKIYCYEILMIYIKLCNIN